MSEGETVWVSRSIQLINSDILHVVVQFEHFNNNAAF